jgi:hypothetical protein
MEVTALKRSSGAVQHFADRIIAERGVRYGRVAMIFTLDERDAGGRMFVPGHVWTTPALQEESDVRLAVGCKSCVRPVCAVPRPLALM